MIRRIVSYAAATNATRPATITSMATTRATQRIQ
jgi:hypothetical protein